MSAVQTKEAVIALLGQPLSLIHIFQCGNHTVCGRLYPYDDAGCGAGLSQVAWKEDFKCPIWAL